MKGKLPRKIHAMYSDLSQNRKRPLLTSPDMCLCLVFSRSLNADKASSMKLGGTFEWETFTLPTNKT